MDKIKFINDNNYYNVELKLISYAPIRYSINFIESPIPSIDIFLSGFELINENSLIVQGTEPFTSLKYLYQHIDDNYIILTTVKDDIYIEPQPIPEPTPTPDPELSLEDVKHAKFQEISHMCAININTGVTISINEIDEHFSYATAEDQANIKELFDCAIQTGLPVPYHSDGNSCKSYSAEQIVLIYTSCATLKTAQTTYHNQLKEYINTLTDKDEILNISYGQNLTGRYLEKYNELIQIAANMMSTLIAKKTW